MKKVFKSVLAVLMSVLLVFSVMSVAFAAEEEQPQPQQEESFASYAKRLATKVFISHPEFITHQDGLGFAYVAYPAYLLISPVVYLICLFITTPIVYFAGGQLP